MKIYLASSWKNKDAVLKMQTMLHDHGHKVDAFCDESTRHVFSYSELFAVTDREGIDITEQNALTMVDHWRVLDAFMEDKQWIDWADVVILLLPCGKSAHLEAGYAAGRGKKLVIVGGYDRGEFETMYGFADRMFYYSDAAGLLEALKNDIN